MRVAISGSSGLVGSLLCKKLKQAGHIPVRMVRTKSTNEDDCYWDWKTGTIEKERLEGIGACIHLAGENIASRRWTTRQKELIRDSRIQGTRLIAETLAKLPRPPGCFLCASAVGYYGDRADELLTEQSKVGSGFLSDVCVDWESATKAAAAAEIRVVQLRIGMVVDPTGGALKKMLLPFKLGLGGRVGPGTQYMSWISNHDLCNAILYILEHKALNGPINTVAPEPLSNQEFTRLLGQALCRPTIFPLPAVLIRMLFGELGDAALLASTRAKPEKLSKAGFSFAHPTFETALQEMTL